jgi:hypothetical protein
MISWSKLLRFGCGAMMITLPALAQAQTPGGSSAAPLDSVPEKVALDAKPTEPARNLSEKLDQSNGIIRPKEVDPAIQTPAPTGNDSDIVRPPSKLSPSPLTQPK